MSLPGSFSVAPSGAAGYSIPIQAPPGIAGVEPKLALNFSSQSGNGLLGVGWTLSGLSVITRCPQTVPQDNARGGVTYTAADRFCLDGQRLMLVAGTGAYGAANSEYRTEIESFSKVTALGTEAGGGPSYFVVKAKSGLTMEFGNTADSRIYITRPGVTLPVVARAWALNKMSDSKGNTLTASYNSVAFNGSNSTTYVPDAGSYYPNRVDYTSNPSTGLAASSSIIFNYETRGDLVSAFQGGANMASQQRLKNITTQSAGTNVFVYSPTYEVSPGTKRSRITAITLCAASGVCLPATTTTLSSALPQNNLSFTSLQSSSDTCLISCGIWQTLDLNNDGKMDLVHLTTNPGGVIVWLSNGNGTFAPQGYQVSDTALTTGTWQVLDVNGDGLGDLVHLKDDAGHVSVWKSNGDGTFTISNLTFSTGPTLSNGTWLVLDVTGDGLADLVHITTNLGDMRQWKSNGDGTFAMSAMTRASNSPSADTNLLDGGNWQVLDINGDGLSDLVHLTNNDGDTRVWRSNGDGTFYITQFNASADTVYSNGFWRVMDMNDDGLLDLLHFTTNSGDLRVWISRGDGTFQISAVTNTVDTALTAGSWQIVDINGDGRQDLLHLTTSSTFYLWTFDGRGALFTQPLVLSGIDTCLTCGNWQVGDFSGQGFPDFVHMRDDIGSYTVWNMPRAVGDLPSAISSGIGTKISWTMATLPTLAPGGYSRSIPSDLLVPSAPVTGALTVVPAIPVVSSVSANNGVGAARRTFYAYDSMRMERNGRGYLGFNWVQATDFDNWAPETGFGQLATGIVTRTIYALNFPFTGMPVQIGKGTSAAAWSNLSLTANAYGCNDPAAASPTSCTHANGRRYYVYPYNSVVTSNDLDGTALPQSVTTNTNVDNYGNIGTVSTVIRNANGSSTEYSNVVTNTYAAPDLTKWYIGRLLKSTVASSGPNVPAVVVPGSGGLPAAPSPNLPAPLMSVILNMLLDD